MIAKAILIVWPARTTSKANKNHGPDFCAMSDAMPLKVTANWVDLHLQIGIEAMTEVGQKGEKIKHFLY